MKDFTTDIIHSVLDRMYGNFKVYTIETDRMPYPYIYLGNFTSIELPNKTRFRLYGTFQLVYRTKGSTSLAEPFRDVAVIRDSMIHYKGDVLFNEMVYLKEMLVQPTVKVLDANDIYSTVITYEYEADAPISFYDRVIISNGTVEALNCTKNKIL